ncbi:MAG: tyrosine-type recombinase/integrase, partial [Deferribacteraceae bacterium]|nr:tyrosine-type recombinase/integrase [Deferribacteraceae bacterium]
DSTKTGEDRFVDITETLDPYIEKHFKMMETQKGNPNGYLFVNQYQKRIVECTTMAEWYWRPTLKRLNINYRQPYHMRHTFACQSIAAGEDLNWIKKMLGHETLEMLLRTYGNWLIKREGRAGNKLNGYFNEFVNENETSKS